MNQPSPTSAQRFAAIVAALRDQPDVTAPSDEPGTRRGFGSNGLKVRGKLFVLLTRDRLAVKLPRSRVDELVAAGVGDRYDPRRDGREMKEWLHIDANSVTDWLALAREALAFVGART